MTYDATMKATERKPYFKLTTNIPYLTLPGELWGVYYDNMKKVDRVITTPNDI